MNECMTMKGLSCGGFKAWDQLDFFNRYPLSNRVDLIIGNRHTGDRFELGTQVLHTAVTHHISDLAQGQFSVSYQLLHLFDLVQNGEFFQGDLLML